MWVIGVLSTFAGMRQIVHHRIHVCFGSAVSKLDRRNGVVHKYLYCRHRLYSDRSGSDHVISAAAIKLVQLFQTAREDLTAATLWLPVDVVTGGGRVVERDATYNRQ